jgi:hypothetical protein
VLRAEEGMNAAEAAAETVSSIRRDAKFGVPPDGWEAFQKRLALLLEDDDVLGLSAKAVTISSETERHVHEFRVFTDARPIFGESAKDGAKAFAVIHTLQVKYYADEENHEWFVSLDADDMKSLQKAVERALTKESSLQATLGQLGIPILSWKVSDNGH